MFIFKELKPFRECTAGRFFFICDLSSAHCSETRNILGSTENGPYLYMGCVHSMEMVFIYVDSKMCSYLFSCMYSISIPGLVTCRLYV
jgi:hypothetical protein